MVKSKGTCLSSYNVLYYCIAFNKKQRSCIRVLSNLCKDNGVV